MATIFVKNRINLLYTLYVCLGGILNERLDFKLKFLYYLYNVVHLTIGTVASLISFYRVHSTNLNDVNFMVYGALSFQTPICLLGIDAFTFFYNRHFPQLLREFDVDLGVIRDGNRDSPSSAAKMTKYGYNKRFFTFIVLDVIAVLALLTARFIDAAVSTRYRNTTINNYESYLYTTPFADYVHSVTLYLIISVFQTFMISVAIIKIWMLPVFLLNFVAECCDQFDRVAHRMRYASAEFAREIESRLSSLSDERGASFDDQSTRRTALFEKFASRQIVSLKLYRRLLTLVQKMRSFVQLIFIIGVTIFSLTSISFLSMLTQPKTQLIMKILACRAVPFLTAMLFFCCYVGKKLDDANDMMEYTVYDAPWYYFTKKESLFWRTLLCEVQQTRIKFATFKMYPINMVSFFKVLKITYSIVNLIRQSF